MVKEFVEALKLGFEKESPEREDMSLDLTVTDEKAQSKAKVKNTLAVHYVRLSFENEEQLG